MSSILLFALDSALSLYNFGSGTTSQGTGYFERFQFSWDSISEMNWIMWGLTVGWYALLVIPWIQYFNAVRMEGRFSRTLAAMNDKPFFSAAFTVSNISLVIASTLFFIRTGEPGEKGLIENYERLWNELLMAISVADARWDIFSFLS